MKVIVNLTIAKREGETDAEAKERLLSLVDSELCHLADHDIRADDMDETIVRTEILKRVDCLKRDLSNDAIERNDYNRVSSILYFIQNIMSGFCKDRNGDSANELSGKSYLELITEIRDLMDRLDWDEIGGHKIVTTGLDDLVEILWKYSY